MKHLCPYSHEFCIKACVNNHESDQPLYSWENPKSKLSDEECQCMCDCGKERTTECAMEI